MQRSNCSSILIRSLRVAWFGGAIVGLLAPTRASGQPAFAPPPTPTASPSAVRGVANPSTTPSSPASVWSPTDRSPVRPVEPITPTPLGSAQPLAGGELVARVDGQIVLASDVLWQVNQMIEANRQRIPPGEEESVRRALLRQQVMGLIDTKLLYADFRRAVPAENIPMIEENLKQPFQETEIPRLVKALQVKDRRELAALLERDGTSLADIQRQFTERALATEWLRQRIDKPKPVTHEEMLAYYQAHRTEYEFPAQARWEEIMVRIDRVDGDRAVAWQTIAEMGNDVWQRVTNNPTVRGPIFTDVAKQKSHGFTAAEGGSHDWTTRGALRSKEIDQALFQLQVGQLSNIIESDVGFHIVRVLERIEAGCRPFTEAQADIRKTIEKQRQQGLVEAEMAKLRRQSRVWTVFDGELSGPEVADLLEQRERR